MANLNGDAIVLDPRRNQGMEKRKRFEEMLLKEIPGLLHMILQKPYCLLPVYFFNGNAGCLWQDWISAINLVKGD